MDTIEYVLVLMAFAGVRGVLVVGYKLLRHGGRRGWLRAEYGDAVA